MCTVDRYIGWCLQYEDMKIPKLMFETENVELNTAFV
jgi:hypothetical protein